MAKRINIADENELVSMIEEGLSYCQIHKRTGRHYGTIERAAKRRGVYEQMRENNQQYKEKVSTQRGIETRRRASVVRYKKIDKHWGSTIKRMILSGAHMAPILEAANLSQSIFQSYLTWKEPFLVGVLKKNSERVLQENRIISSLKGAEVTRGNELKKIPILAEEMFCQLVKEGEHLASIKRKMMSKWKLGDFKIKQLCDKHGRPIPFDASGENNNMFGVPCPRGAGIGTKGWLKLGGERIFFRSSLEMKVFLFLWNKEVGFSLANHRIPYFLKGKKRAYCPDYVSGIEVCEIKPSALIDTEENRAKFKAAKEYCGKFNLEFRVVTEKTFELPILTKDVILDLERNNILEINEKNRQKLLRNL